MTGMMMVRILSRLQISVVSVLIAVVGGAWTTSTAQTTGYHDFSFGSTISAPTESKPESKLWFNDGVWWGVMFNSSLQGYDIFKLNLATQTWADTGTAVDDRAQSNADALWDQASGKLYIVSNLHTTPAAPNSTSSSWGRLYRYTYDSSSQSYILDAGFPVTVTKGKEETLTLAKDSTGELWVAYVESSKVMVNHSVGSDNVWGTPFALPVGATSISVTSDDIASIIAFGQNKIGVFWSNQKTNRDYFAIHHDGDVENTWLAEETAWGGGVNCTGACADDHINLKTDSAGKIYVAAKTSFTGATDPFIVLLVRNATGTWSSATESLHANTNTRGIVLLDELHDRLHIFVASNEAGGNILYKSTSMSNPSFAVSGQGDIFIDNPTDAHLNNPSATKQNLTSDSGLLVLASDGTSHFYAHNFADLDKNVPTILSFAPTSGGAGTSVVLTGTGFLGANSVKFNGVTASFNVNSDTQITTTVPLAATTGVITVANFVGTGTSASFVVPPTITSISPSSGVVGVAVTVKGTNFSAATAVAFNGAPATFVINSSTQITATVPSGATTGKITVTNSDGTATSANTFTVKPAITSFSPASGGIGVPVTITGTSFTGATSVKFYNNKTATFTVISDTRIDTTVPTGTTTGVLKVTTPGGTATSSTNFIVGVPPAVTSFSPASGLVGASISISGSGFSGASAVKFNGTAATTFNVASDGQINATVPGGATSGLISVTTATGTGTSGSSFTVLPPPPVISSFTPTMGPDGTRVTINGSNLSNASSVTIAGAAAAITSNSANQIMATVGAAPQGPGLIVVSTPGGTTDTRNLGTPNFTVTAGTSSLPSITSFTPTSGTIGTSVTINGVNFTGTTAVTFNGTSASFHFVSDSQLTATVPAGATTGPISVTNGSGTASTSTLSPANFSLTRIKDITFEAGSLTGASGFGTTTGTVTLETGSPLKGADSMTIGTGTSYGTQTYTATDEIFISLYVRIGAIPAGQVRLLRIASSATTVGAITLEKTTGAITLRNGTTAVGVASAPLTPGTVYRIGIHQKKGTGSNAVLEGFIATGDAAFGAPFASSGVQTFTTQADSSQIGATTGTAGSLTLDNILLDTGAMPGPSVP